MDDYMDENENYATMEVINKQWNVIKLVAKLFNKNDIEYHYDASTAAFVHGCNFEMSDIDVVIIHDVMEKVGQILKPYFELTELEYMAEHNLDFFFALRDGQKVHCLFYRDMKSEDTTFYDEVEVVEVDGQKIYSKSINYYLRRKKMKHYLEKLIKEKSGSDQNIRGGAT